MLTATVQWFWLDNVHMLELCGASLGGECCRRSVLLRYVHKITSGACRSAMASDTVFRDFFQFSFIVFPF